MNHCVDCGARVNTGRQTSFTDHKATRCLICQTNRKMANFHYDSPSAKRWRARHEEATRRKQRIAAGQMELNIDD